VGGATAAAVASSAAFPPNVIMAASFFSKSTMRFSSLRSSLRTGFPACVFTPRENRIEDIGSSEYFEWIDVGFPHKE
jgi:hypothetical protein